MIWYFVVGINVIAVIIFIFLVLHYKKKWEGIKHYEKIRDKLTVREEEPEEEDDGGGFSFPLGQLIGAFVVVLVGVNIVSVVSDEVNQTMNATSITLVADSLLNIFPLFFALGIMSAGVALVVGGLRNAGLK